MRIDFEAADSDLIAAPDGAVATLRVDGSDEIVGFVVNHISADGYTVSTFATDCIGFCMPVIEMTRDDPRLEFEVIAEDIDTFYSTRSHGEHGGFVTKICMHHDWFCETSAMLHCAYWLGKKYPKPVTQDQLFAANSMVKASRELYYSFCNSIQILDERAA